MGIFLNRSTYTLKAMEDVKEAYERLINSEEFCTGAKGEDAYLSSFSVMTECTKLETAAWQVDYYSPSLNKITSFVMKSKIEIKPDQAMFQGGGANQLDLSATKVSFKDALAKSETILREKLKEYGQSIIAVLQNRKKALWIITYITPSMKVACIEIDAETGESISERADSFVMK